MSIAWSEQCHGLGTLRPFEGMDNYTGVSICRGRARWTGTTAYEWTSSPDPYISRRPAWSRRPPKRPPACAELAQRGDRTRQVWYVLGCLEAALDIVTAPRYGADPGAIACRRARAFLRALDAHPSAPTDAAPADLGTASAGHGRVLA